MNDKSNICIHLSDHAGWWLQGTESPGRQKTHPEDDGREGEASFAPGMQT